MASNTVASSRSLTAALLITLLAQAITPAAAAQTAPVTAVSQDDRDRANALMDEGDEKTEKGDHAGALAAYEKAHAIMHVPTTGIEVARALDRLGRLLAALAAAREVAATQASDGEPKPFTEARAQAASLVTALEQRVPTLTIKVTAAAAGAQPDVLLDGRKLKTKELAAPIALEPGTYRVSAAAEGHTPASVEVTLKERDRAQAALALAKVGIAPAVTVKPPPPPVRLSPFVPVGFSLAGVGAIAGAITGALALSAANEANNWCPKGVCPAEGVRRTAQGRYDTADTLAIVSDVSFALAVVGAAMGIYGVAVTVPSSEAKGAGAAVLIGPGGGAVRVAF